MTLPNQQTAYLAARGFEAELEAELEGSIVARYGRLFLTNKAAIVSIWAQCIWYAPEVIPVESIKKAAEALKSRQRNWALYDYQLHRRAGLIESALPHVGGKPIVFPSPLPKAPLGGWTLIDESHILASAQTNSPYKNGEVLFAEDKEIPPNRAYLKLWEFFTLEEINNLKGQLCLDMGACPGGWTWVLATLGAQVISVDKAPLAPHIASMKGITYHQGSAFALEPKDHPPVDWLFSDIACYPERLLKLVERWRASGKVKNFCCTIKLQGETDFEAIRAFAAIKGSVIRHLYNNKHELTWSLRQDTV